MALTQTDRKLLAKKVGRKEFAWVHKDPQTGQTKYGYPIHDANHVQMAIKMFAAHYQNIPANERATIARKIYAAAKRFGIEVKTPEILRYVRLDRAVKKAELLDFLHKRHLAAPVAPQVKTGYAKLAEQLTRTRLNWRLVDEVLAKVATYDNEYLLDRDPLYKDPYEVFDRFFLDARVHVKIAGMDEYYSADYTQIPLDVLVSILDMYKYE